MNRKISVMFTFEHFCFSFDPASVYCFLTVFNPFVMGALMMTKVCILAGRFSNSHSVFCSLKGLSVDVLCQQMDAILSTVIFES